MNEMNLFWKNKRVGSNIRIITMMTMVPKNHKYIELLIKFLWVKIQ